MHRKTETGGPFPGAGRRAGRAVVPCFLQRSTTSSLASFVFHFVGTAQVQRLSDMIGDTPEYRPQVLDNTASKPRSGTNFFVRKRF